MSAKVDLIVVLSVRTADTAASAAVAACAGHIDWAIWAKVDCIAVSFVRTADWILLPLLSCRILRTLTGLSAQGRFHRCVLIAATAA
jgi:hypothetical protein